MSKLAVFISGSGTNAENIIQYFQKKKSAEISIVVSDNESAYGLQRAKNLNVPTHCFTKGQFKDGTEVLELLKENEISFIVLAGFLSFVPDSIVSAYAGRIVNIHPSLLPKHGGKGMYGSIVHQSVVANNEKESGITIHFVNEKFDDGEIIFQVKCSVESTDEAQEVEKKVRALEMEHYPQVVEQVLMDMGIL